MPLRRRRRRRNVSVVVPLSSCSSGRRLSSVPFPAPRGGSHDRGSSLANAMYRQTARSGPKEAPPSRKGSLCNWSRSRVVDLFFNAPSSLFPLLVLFSLSLRRARERLLLKAAPIAALSPTVSNLLVQRQERSVSASQFGAPENKTRRSSSTSFSSDLFKTPDLRQKCCSTSCSSATQSA